MKKKLLTLWCVLVASLCATAVQAQTVFPYLPQQNSFGGSAADPTTFLPPSGEYTLEVDGTSGTQISIAGGVYAYTPTADGKIRFAQKNGKVYVYENAAYKTTLTPVDQTAYPTITDADAATNSAQLLSNCSFETLGTLVGGTNYNFGSPWQTNVAVPASGGIRIGTSGSAVNGSYVVVWRGSGNTNYFAQALTSIKPNTAYKVQIKQVAGGNAFATFNIGLGSTVSGMEYGKTTLVLGNGKDGVWTAYITTSSNVSEGGTVYFTFSNTSANTANAGSDPVVQMDYVSLVEGVTPTGILGASNPMYLAGTAYAPEFTPNYASGDYYDITSFIKNAAVASATDWTGASVNSGQQYTGAPDNTYLDKWNSSALTFDMYQVINNLPNGRYKLVAAVRSSVTTTRIYATTSQEYSETIPNTGSTGNVLGNGWQDLEVSDIIVSAGTMRIGFAGSVNNTWAGADNFRLYFYGYDPTSAIASLNAQISQVTTDLVGKVMQTTVATSLNQTITQAQDAIANNPTEVALTAAATAMNTAVTNAEISIASYVSLHDVLTAANANKANYSTFAGYAAFETAITTAQGVYDTATADTAAVKTAINTLKKAENTCRLTQATPVNCTWLLANPNASDGNNGWIFEGSKNNPASNESWLGATPANPYFDGGNWGGTGWTTNMSQIIPDLPAGKYTLKAVTRASTEVTMTLSAKVGLTTYKTTCSAVGNVGGAIWDAAETGSVEKGVNAGNGFGWSNSKVEFTLLKGESLTINFNSTTAGFHQWFSVDQFELIYEAAENVASPKMPVAPAITVPAQTKPVTSGEYLVYHTVANKFLTNNAAVGSPVLSAYGYVKTNNAFLWNVTVSGASNDTITLKQVSSSKFMNASTTNTWSVLLGAEDATTSKWILKDVADGYNFASKRSAAKLVGMDATTGNEVGIYYDKDAAKNPLFKFIKKDDFYTAAVIAYEDSLAAYSTDLAAYNAKVKLMAEITRAMDMVAAHPVAYPAEATNVFGAVIVSAKDLYLNATITLAEVEQAIVNVNTALNTYLMSAFATASEENPVDVTFLLTNPTFSNGATGWNGAVGTATGGSTNMYEMYQMSNFDMNQMLKGLPAGYYQLTAQGFAREKGNDAGAAYAAGTEDIKAYLYGKAGEVRTQVKFVSLYSQTATGSLNDYANNVAEANTAFLAGKYNNSVVLFLDADQALTIGARYDGVHVGGSWTAYDNFKLIYKGNTLNTLINEVKDEITKAKAVTGIMQAAVSTALADTIAAAEVLVAPEANPSKAELETIKAQLINNVVLAKASIVVYEKLHVAIINAEAFDAGGDATVAAAIATANDIYTAKAVDAAGIDAAIFNLKLAINTYVVLKARSTNKDVTPLIVNPNIMQSATSVQTRPAGWESSTNSNTNGNFTKLAGAAGAPVDTYLESWGGTASTIVFDYYQTIIIPNGDYKLGAATFADDTSGNAVLYANEVTTPMRNGVNGDSFSQTTVNTELTVKVTNNLLRIGVKTIGALNGAWSGADYFHLTDLYVGVGFNTPDAVVVDAYAEGSSIVVTGVDSYEIYNLQGLRIPADTKLNAGVYIVKTAVKTLKVIVK